MQPQPEEASSMQQPMRPLPPQCYGDVFRRLHKIPFSSCSDERYKRYKTPAIEGYTPYLALHCMQGARRADYLRRSCCRRPGPNLTTMPYHRPAETAPIPATGLVPEYRKNQESAQRKVRVSRSAWRRSHEANRRTGLFRSGFHPRAHARRTCPAAR